MQTSTENVDCQNMTQNMALNSKQEIKISKNTQAEDKKRRETSVKNLIGYEWKEASNGAKIEVVIYFLNIIIIIQQIKNTVDIC